MTSDRCHTFRAAISARLDDQLAPQKMRDLEAHLETCSDCRSFALAQHQLRRSLRLVQLENAPDVVPAVMARVTRESGSDVWSFRLRLTAVAAVAAALVVLATSLPVLETAPQVAQASDIARQAFSTARELEAYRATFRIVERGWHPDVGERLFHADVWYRAPEDFRLRVRDRTSYPTGAWPRNDIDVASTSSRSWIREPYGCPTEALPGCAIRAGVEERTIVRRQPFDGTSLAPTDIVVPLETLATFDALDVQGTERVSGRRALHVTLSYRQGFPLVDALQQGGEWVPLLPLDRVDVWLDSTTWFPLRYEVSRGEARPFLEVSATSFSEPDDLPDSRFRPPVGGSVRSGGFIRDALSVEFERKLRDVYLAGLEPYVTGRIGRARQVASFTDGLSFVKITFDTAPGPPNVDEITEEVALSGNRVAYYKPAGPGSPRRMDLFSGRLHVRVESNLRREQLTRIADDMPVAARDPGVGLRVKGSDVIRMSAEQLRKKGYELQPDGLPGGYRVFGGWVSTGRDGNETAIIFSPSETGLEGSEIRVFESTRVRFLPPTSENLVGVEVDGVTARWSPERGELEWIDRDGVYRAVTAPSLDLAGVMRIARSLE